MADATTEEVVDAKQDDDDSDASDVDAPHSVATRHLKYEDGTAFKCSVQGIVHVQDPAHKGGFEFLTEYLAGSSGIFRVSPTGEVALLAGDAEETGDVDGVGAAARFEDVYGLVRSLDGTALFVCDSDACKVKRIAVATGEVTTFAGSGREGDRDGAGAAASFDGPCGLAISPDGKFLYVADSNNHKIRQIEVATAAVTSLAGSGDNGDADGVGGEAEFDEPCSVAITPDGTALFVADRCNNVIRRVATATGDVTTFAGSGDAGDADGVGDEAEFDEPSGIAISPDGVDLFVADRLNNKVKRIAVETGDVSTFAGTGGEGAEDGDSHEANLMHPYAVVVTDCGGELVVSSALVDNFDAATGVDAVRDIRLSVEGGGGAGGRGRTSSSLSNMPIFRPRIRSLFA